MSRRFKINFEYESQTQRTMKQFEEKFLNENSTCLGLTGLTNYLVCSISLVTTNSRPQPVSKNALDLDGYC